METYGAFSGWGEAVALDEDKAAGTALGRDNLKETPVSLDTETDVFQVVVNLLLRYVGKGGDIPGGERLDPEQVYYRMADCLLGLTRYGRFSRFLSHGDSWREDGQPAKYYHLMAALQSASSGTSLTTSLEMSCVTL
jgi:hypothetical protein